MLISVGKVLSSGSAVLMAQGGLCYLPCLLAIASILLVARPCQVRTQEDKAELNARPRHRPSEKEVVRLWGNVDDQHG